MHQLIWLDGGTYHEQCAAMARRNFNVGWEPTLGQMIALGIKVQATCDRCPVVHLVELDKLAARVGPHYSLFNRRCRCRLTPGCLGWNRFYHNRSGVFLPFCDDRGRARWLWHD